MSKLILELHKTLNMIKDFGASYSSSGAHKGYIMVTYKGKRYAVKAVEMDETDQLKDGFDAIDNIKKYF